MGELGRASLGYDLEVNWEKQTKMESIEDDGENSAIRTLAVTEEEEQPSKPSKAVLPVL